MSTNRLANETSPYLLQHAHNPVDWYPWGEEAFARARAEDKPLLLSVGYSACHWCHVMERESFENPDIAGADEPPLREHEGGSRGAAGRRSDLHAGRAVDDRPRRLADDRVPHARRHALLRRDVLPAATIVTACPGFPRLLQAIADAWQSRRGEVVQSGRQLNGVARPDRAAARARPTLLTRRDPVRRVPGIVRAVRRGMGRLGRRAEVPAADDLGVRAALLEAHAEPASRERMVHTTLDPHGARRDVRPARRRLRALLGGRALAGAALREDAVRQRPARLALPARLAGVRRSRVPPRLRGDARLSAARHGRPGRRLLLRRGRRLRGPRGQVLRLDARRDPRGAGRRRRPGLAYWGVDRGPELRGPEHPVSRRRARPRRHRAVAPAAVGGARAPRASRAATTRCWRPGTAWPVARWPRRAARSGAPTTWRRPCATPSSCWARCAPTAGCMRTWKGGQARILGYLEDYAMVAAALLDVYEATFERRWLDEARSLCRRHAAAVLGRRAGGLLRHGRATPSA